MSKSFLQLSISSASLLRTATPSALRFGPFMAKLQCSGYKVPCYSPFGSYSRNYQQCSRLRLRNAGVSYALSGLRPGNRLSYWYLSLSNGIVSGSCEYVGVSKRHFGRASGVEPVTEDKSKYRKFNKLAAQSKSKVSEDVDDALPLGENADGEAVSSVTTAPVGDDKTKSSGKKKRQTRSKLKKEESSNAVASEEAANVTKSPKSTKRSSNGRSSKSGKSVAKKAEDSIGKKPEESLDDPALTQSSKRSSKTRGKATKAAIKSENAQNCKVMGNIKPLAQQSSKPLYPPTGKSVMVVESVTKAKVIQGYLGDMFEVVPSYGHIRDLSPRSGSVRPNEDFSMVWEVLPGSWTHLKSIKVSLSGAENLILASDPDREGEAIAWHIIEMLQQQNALSKGINVARVVFNEITEASIKNALQAPREIDLNLVQAYLARRALDYLIGFNVSPLLWRKLPGCQSAGRVQSAALSLTCDREMEIDEFKPQEHWSVEAALKGKKSGFLVNARLTHFESKKLNQLSISSCTQASDIEERINSETFLVLGSKTNKTKRNPPIPYITSTLQQDAASKLNFNASYTMKMAQKLYEGIQLSDGKAKGLITYIRTDGLHISEEALKDIRSLILERYGSEFASVSPRKYFKKVKNAQEAHEAIRPTDIQILPSMLVDVLDYDSLKLYTLIWARTVACQMESATVEQILVEVANTSESIIFRTACSMVEFLGYQAVYEDTEARAIKYKEDDSDHREACEALKLLKPGDPLHIEAVDRKQHFTQHPPRYSEASLVKKMEELGIGRPSTYASTLKLLQDRKYVTMKNRALHPEFRGRMVSAFLSHYFTEVTDYSFTADMETELDNVSAGITEWKGLLKDYWTRFSSNCSRTQNVHIHQVEKMLEKTFGDYLFGSLKHDNRTCPSCEEGALIFKVSRFGKGYFIGCDQHPKCKYIAKTLYGNEEDDEETPESETSLDEPKVLGLHPVSGEKILLKNGPFGYYVQLGDDRNGYSPKRASLSHLKDVDSVTVEDATELLQYPVTLGNHPKDGQPVLLKLRKSGFTIRHRRSSAPVPKNTKREDITLEKALKYLSGSNVKKSGRPKSKPKLEAYEAV